MGILLKTIGVMLVSTGVAMAADTFQNWPIKGSDEKDATVQAAYKEQCEKWAAEKAADAKGEFVKNCVKRMEKTWPVGYSMPYEGGGGGG